MSSPSLFPSGLHARRLRPRRCAYANTHSTEPRTEPRTRSPASASLMLTAIGIVSSRANQCHQLINKDTFVLHAAMFTQAVLQVHGAHTWKHRLVVRVRANQRDCTRSVSRLASLSLVAHRTRLLRLPRYCSPPKHAPTMSKAWHGFQRVYCCGQHCS